MMEFGQDVQKYDDIARKCKYMKNKITDYQNSFNAIEKVFCSLWKLQNILRSTFSTDNY